MLPRVKDVSRTKNTTDEECPVDDGESKEDETIEHRESPNKVRTGVRYSKLFVALGLKIEFFI